MDAVGNNNGWITQCKLIWASWMRVLWNVMKISGVGHQLLASRAVSLATLCRVGSQLRAVGYRAPPDRAKLRTSQAAELSNRRARCDQLNMTPLALSHGSGLIAWYTSPYLTPAG